MGYRTESNYNLPQGEPASFVQSNAPFSSYYQGRIRFLEAESALNNKPQDYQLSRGYIRNLSLPVLAPTTIYKCKFQFNPQEIKQTVSMREDMYLSILQDPAQLAQPIGAQMNFQFDLFFDRQYEMSIGTDARVDPLTAPIPGSSSGFLMEGAPANEAAEIGVYADLRVLYAVIGQGFNPELLDNQLDVVAASAARVFAATNTNTASAASADTTGSTESVFSFDANKAQSALEANVGNAAILMPNPVRVMFSSLLMVDGFVTATSVDFLKFNTKMIPTQCRVTLSMNAVYVGFANKDTFLTMQFEDARQAIEDQNNRSAAGNKELLTALTNGVKSVTFGYARDIEGGQSPKIDRFDKPGYALYTFSQTGAKNYSDRNFFFRFDDVIPKKGDGQDQDLILNMYERGDVLKIDYSWAYTIFGYDGITATETQMRNALSAIAIGSNEIDQSKDANLVILGSYSGSKSASSRDEWGHGTSGDGASWNKARRYSRHSEYDEENTNNSQFAPADEGIYANPSLPAHWHTKANAQATVDGYCIVVWELELSVQKGDLNPVYPLGAVDGQIVQGNRVYVAKVVTTSSASNIKIQLKWQ